MGSQQNTCAPVRNPLYGNTSYEAHFYGIWNGVREVIETLSWIQDSDQSKTTGSQNISQMK